MGLLGCATAPQAPTPATAPVDAARVVEERAKARWSALIKGDLPAAYAMLSPASRGAVTLTNFLAQHAKGTLYWRKADQAKAECEAESCTVTVTLEYDLRDAVKGLKRDIKETWVRDEGQWWLVYSQR
jgi:hypothetical protein